MNNGSEMCCSKNDPRPFEVHEQVESALFQPIASQFGLSKVTKGHENGLLWEQKSIKNGSKMCLSKDTFGLFGVQTQLE